MESTATLKQGHSHDVIQENVRELVRTGLEPEMAIAKALAEARKSKKEMPAETEPVADESKLAEALTETETVKEPVIIDQELTDAAKQAILDRKKRRVLR